MKTTTFVEKYCILTPLDFRYKIFHTASMISRTVTPKKTSNFQLISLFVESHDIVKFTSKHVTLYYYHPNFLVSVVHNIAAFSLTKPFHS